MPWRNQSEFSVLGGETFVQSLREKVGSKLPLGLEEIKRTERQLIAKPLNWYVFNIHDPKEAMALAFESGAFTMKEIGARFGVHYTTVSRAVQAHRRRGRDKA